ATSGAAAWPLRSFPAGGATDGDGSALILCMVGPRCGAAIPRGSYDPSYEPVQCGHPPRTAPGRQARAEARAAPRMPEAEGAAELIGRAAGMAERQGDEDVR